MTFAFSYKKASGRFQLEAFHIGALARTRTADQLIKSQLLYRLSYEGFFN